jgi:ATP phosphoribosyltransferase regulatory subunit
MQSLQPDVHGTRDYAGGDAVALQRAREAIEATLRRYAYVAIDPPILESSSPFLNRSGEDIRRHMYIFPDPGGREVCLRPELTIPVCRAYLRQMSAKGRQGIARLSYFGPAFTYEPATAGRYRQFYQAGAEFIGAQWREAADAEILAAALDALDATGLTDTAMEAGDVDIRNAFIDQLPLSERSKARIRRIALRKQRDPRALSAVAAEQAAETDQSNGFGELASLLAAVEPGKAELLIREVFALADVRHVGGRTPEEIIERLTSGTAQQAEPISAELTQGVVELLNIRGKPETAFQAISEHFRKFRIGAIEPILERCERRLRYVEAYRQRPPAVVFNVGLRRDLEYYTGFLFEIYATQLTQIGHLCGGGRYDNLLEGLGANASIPAVGFGIRLDRLLLAQQAVRQPDSSEPSPPQALVVGAGAKQHQDCIRACVALREAGWSVELDASERDEAAALHDAAKRKIPYLVSVTQEKGKKGEVRVRRLRDRADQRVALTELAAYAQSEGANRLPGKTP